MPPTDAAGEGRALADRLEEAVAHLAALEADRAFEPDAVDRARETIADMLLDAAPLVIAALRAAADSVGGDAEAMRERCARWHDDKARDHDTESQWPGIKLGLIGAHRDRASLHRRFAEEIRALSLSDPPPHPEARAGGGEHG